MKIMCPDCKSENLDQGVNDVILCHDCKRFWKLVGTWYDNIEKNNLQDLV